MVLHHWSDDGMVTYHCRSLVIVKEGVKKNREKRSGWLTASVCENFDPFLSFIKWHYKPKYDNLSRNFTFTCSLRGSGEGDGVRVDSKEVCVLIYYWWGTWTHPRASASTVADATVTPSHPLACCRMSCFSVFNYLVFTPIGVITPNCVLLHRNVYFFSKANSFIKFHKLSILKAYISLHHERVGGRNCFLGHGVTFGLLNRLLPLQNLQSQLRVWDYTTWCKS